MKNIRISAGYRENCGGYFRSVSTGLHNKLKSLADWHLYEDLRERVFGQNPASAADAKKKA